MVALTEDAQEAAGSSKQLFLPFPDQPIRVEEFKRAVRWRRWLLAVLLTASIALGIAELMFSSRDGDGSGGGWPGKRRPWRWTDQGWWTLGGLGLCILFLPFVLLSFRRSALQGPNYAKHRKLCERGTWLMLFAVITPLAPWVIYVCEHKCAPPPASPDHASRSIHAAVSYARFVVSVIPFLTISSTRRGPHIAAPEVKAMKAGFGVSAEDFDVADHQRDAVAAAAAAATVDATGEGARVDGHGRSSGANNDDERAPLLNECDRTAPSRRRYGSDGDEDARQTGKEDVFVEQNVWDIFNSSCLSFAFGSYIVPFCKASLSKPQISFADVRSLPDRLRAENGTLPGGVRVLPEKGSMTRKYGNLAQELGEEQEVTPWGLFMYCWRPLVPTLMSCLGWETVRSLSAFLPPLILYEIVDAIKNPVITKDGVADRTYPYFLVLALGLYNIAFQLSSAYNNTRETYLLHVPIKQALVPLLFAKSLRVAIMPSDGAGEQHHESGSPFQEIVKVVSSIFWKRRKPSSPGASSGEPPKRRVFVPQITSLLSIDVHIIASLATKVWNVIRAAVTAGIGIYFLWSFFGTAMFIALGIFLLNIAGNSYISIQNYHCDRALASARDIRINAFAELLRSYKVIKLNAWEPYHLARISEYRHKELKLQRKRYHLGTAWNILNDGTPLLALSATFAFFTWVQGKPLEAASAFASFGIMGPLRDALNDLPSVFQAMLESRIAFDRLCAYLNQPDMAEGQKDAEYEEIVLENVTASWPTAYIDPNDHKPFELQDVNLRFPKGKFTLVYGPLGSGKSLLLSTILGEARVLSGRVLAPCSSPEAIPAPGDEADKSATSTWLVNDVAYASQVSYIRHGTIRDNILFDQVYWPERYAEVLRVTRLLPDLALMRNGDMTEVGESGINLSGGQRARIALARAVYSRAKTLVLDDILSAVDAFTARHIYHQCLKGDLVADRTVILVSHKLDLVLRGADYVVHLNKGRVDRMGSPEEFSDLLEEAIQAPEASGVQSPAASEVTVMENDESARFYATETRAKGNVALQSYLFLLGSAGHIGYWLVFLTVYVVTECLTVTQSYWVRRWTTQPGTDTAYYLTRYAWILVGGYVLGSFRWFWLYGIGNRGFTNRAARIIHAEVLDKVSHAPMRYLQATPFGRLMNRAGQDQTRIDGNVSDDVGRSVSAVASLFAMAVVISITNPTFPLLLLAMILVYYLISLVVRRIRADNRRLSSVAYSPLINLFSDTASSIAIYRSFGAQRSTMYTLSQFLNLSCKIAVLEAAFWNWFQAIMVATTAILVSLSWAAIVWQGVGPAAAGFVMVLTTEIRDVVQNGFLQLMQLEQSIVSSERLAELTEVAQEQSVVGPVIDVPPSWPSEGNVEFQRFCARYDEKLPLVLRDIDLLITAGQRIGIVGATGAGKSTLALSILRAIERSSGRILVDGIDIEHVPLATLRSRLCMLPQEPLLNSGTLREALDITGLKTDAELFEAMRQVHLDLTEGSAFSDLDTKVAIEGSNFSLGERQLLCLARALLKDSKIIVMDEATSNVDYETDAKINTVIRDSFAGTTLIVILHRLQNLVNFDRIVVVDDGRIIESDTPANLYARSDSRFRQMVKADGTHVFDHPESR